MDGIVPMPSWPLHNRYNRRAELHSLERPIAPLPWGMPVPTMPRVMSSFALRVMPPVGFAVEAAWPRGLGLISVPALSDFAATMAV